MADRDSARFREILGRDGRNDKDEDKGVLAAKKLLAASLSKSELEAWVSEL
jgi:hypothetical protein